MDQSVAVACAAGFIGGAVSLCLGQSARQTCADVQLHRRVGDAAESCFLPRCFMAVFDMATDALLYYYGRAPTAASIEA